MQRPATQTSSDGSAAGILARRRARRSVVALDQPLVPPRRVHGEPGDHEASHQEQPYHEDRREADRPVQILDAHFTLHVQSGFVHIEMNDDGSWSGRLGGGISTEEMTTIAMGLNIPSDLMNTVATLLTNTADLAPDPVTNRCTQVSTTLQFESVPAFVLDP